MMIKKKTADNYILSLLFFCIGTWLLQAGFQFTGIIKQIPHFRFIHIPFMYAVGPLIYLYYKHIIMINYRFKPWWILHFLPAVISAGILLIPFYMENPNYKANLVQHAIFFKQPYLFRSFFITITTFTTSAPKLSVIIYLSYLFTQSIKVNSKIWNNIPSRRKNVIIWAFTLIIMNLVTATISFAGDLFSVLLVKISTLIVVVFLCCIFLLGHVYPEYFNILQKVVREGLYEYSRVKGIDLEIINIELKKLMEEEKVFYDDELTLPDLAKRLSITKHQLSEILNKKYKKNFFTYINEYRIREAAKLLIDMPDKKILEISMIVGFNSKSSFNNSFAKYVGLPPSEYRKRFLNNYHN